MAIWLSCVFMKFGRRSWENGRCFYVIVHKLLLIIVIYNSVDFQQPLSFTQGSIEKINEEKRDNMNSEMHS